jgi:hypothetical protein
MATATTTTIKATPPNNRLRAAEAQTLLLGGEKVTGEWQVPSLRGVAESGIPKDFRLFTAVMYYKKSSFCF